MKPVGRVIRKVLREVYLFIRWFFGTRSAPGLFLAVSLILPLYVFYFTVILPAGTCSGDFPVADTLHTEIPEMDQDTLEKVMEQIGIVDKLEQKEAYLDNLLILARQDSVVMNLNLADSVLTLEIRGVPVRVCPLADIRVTRLIRCMDQTQILSWISEPFTGTASLATIPKIPYVIKEAPKDTNEAALQNAKPLPPDSSSVFFTLFFDRQLVVEVEQTEEPYKEEKEIIEGYGREREQRIRTETIRSLLHGTSPEPEMLIRLQVSKADARAIYRGIPVLPKMTLLFP